MTPSAVPSRAPAPPFRASIVASLDGLTAEDIFGHPDTLKFRSSMTLFADVAPDEAVFQACIDKYFDGEPDDETLARL